MQREASDEMTKSAHAETVAGSLYQRVDVALALGPGAIVA
jgi:hypothetical protein